MNPLVSVIVPVYNPAIYFEKTLDSILDQTYENMKVIVIDDGSREEFKHYIDQVCTKDDRVKLIRLLHNQGGGKARNKGLANVSGEYVAFCDSDDLWPKNKIFEQFNYMNANNISMSHCDMIIVDTSYKEKGRRSSSEEIDLKDFLLTTSLFCSSVMLSKNIIGDAKFGEMPARHPFKFWCGILRNGYVSKRVPTTHFKYTVRKNSVSSNKFRMIYYTA